MTSRRPREDLVAEIGDRLRDFVVGILLTNFRAAEVLDLNPTEVVCLCLLLRNGPGPTGRLSEETGLTTGAITGIVDRLEDAGLITRGVDPNDRRRVIVTPDYERIGKDLMPHMLRLQPAASPDFYKRYSADELRLISDFLGRATATESN